MMAANDRLVLPSFNWSIWQTAKDQSIGGTPRTFDKVTPREVASMTDDDLNGYFRHIASFLEKKSQLYILTELEIST